MACKMIPCGEKARFLKTGGEACAAAIKIARAYTGRDHIIQMGYNGWLNSLAKGTRILPSKTVEPTGFPKGVPHAVGELFHAVNWNDRERVMELFDKLPGKVAAVILHSDCVNPHMGVSFFPFLREMADKNGALLILDEIITGMRLAIGGAHEYFGITPDLAVFSKGIANGMPLSVYLGKADVMDACDKKGGAIISSTFAGEAISLAAAKTCFEIYNRENVVGHLWEIGKRMWDGLNGIFKEKGMDIEVVGLYPLGTFQYRDESLMEPFIRAAYRNGVCLYGTSYVNFSHREADIDEALNRLEKACGEVKIMLPS
jgi:glutamate-1-semialdehyde 2,1-aminomutase